MSASTDFYRNLRGQKDFDIFFEENTGERLPDDWLVVVADIEKSTQAVQSGMYREVNAVGVATIVSMMKAAGEVAIPYVFGGDGASFCIPPAILPNAEEALVITKAIARHEFGLGLRAGIVPINDIRQRGMDVWIGKYQPNEYYEQAMFSGNGLSMADSMVKDVKEGKRYRLREVPKTSLSVAELMSGFECRWSEIPGPDAEVVNILIQVEQGNEDFYREIMSRLRSIYGCGEKCYPIRKEDMQLTLDSKKLGVETRIRTGLMPWYRKLIYLVKLKLLVVIGRYFMNHDVSTEETEWGKYKSRLIENTDFQRFDDMLRLMVSGTADQRLEFTRYLDQFKQNKSLVYGVHVTTHSLVTCMIADYNHEHVHFIDGKGGGYTLAAVQLKQQLRDRDTAASLGP
jgi:hypothetical protein